MKKTKFILGMLFSISLLASCGGGGGNSSSSSQQSSSPVEISSEVPTESSEEPVVTSEEAPVETSAAPVEESSEEKPVETSEAPVDTSEEKPVETSEAPVEESSEEPVETSEAPVEESSEEPAEESSEGEVDLYITIHYFRKQATYSDWALWLWPENEDGAEYIFEESDAYGGYVTLPLSTWNVTSATVDSFKLGYIVKSAGSWSVKDPDGDRYIDFSNLEAKDGVYHIWNVSGDATIYTTEPITLVIVSAVFTGEREITLETTATIRGLILYKDGNAIQSLDQFDEDYDIFTWELDEAGDVTASYEIEALFDNGITARMSVSTNSLYDVPEFDKNYFYDGELGAILDDHSTTFKVWSPISSEISVRVYENGTPSKVDPLRGNDSYREFAMVKGDKGVFSATVEENLAGKYYTYFVINGANPEGVEIVDPYAKSAGVNGLRGMIVDFDETNPAGWDEVSAHAIDRKELTVYETHVADVTSSETWNGEEANAKKFAGLIEAGTTIDGGEGPIATGFDHIKELGVNAVQLIPIFDQDNNEIETKFNWGYNPLNYNVVEGSYSKNPYDGYERIRELKEVVKAYNEAGINIIMDVVYNHVMDAGNSNFQKLMPNYYFRLNAAGGFSNGSGCGNETASDRSMFNKFMRDSTKFWASEYKLGGFRFDLMGLHDLDTMQELTEDLKEVNDHIVVYGEPWTGGGTPLASELQAKTDNIAKFEGYGAFSDYLRDNLIKSGMHDAAETGWADGAAVIMEANNVVKGLRGCPTASSDPMPDKVVSYVTCHDNYTLYDRFVAADTANATKHTEEQYEAMALLAQSSAALAQGTFFMLAGEEMLRTKGGDHNSYDSGYEVNALNYEWKVNHPEMFEFYKLLISLKQTCPGLHLDAASAKEMAFTLLNKRDAIIYDVEGTDGDVYRIALTSPERKKNDTANFAGFELVASSLGETELSSETLLRDGEVIIAVSHPK